MEVIKIRHLLKILARAILPLKIHALNVIFLTPLNHAASPT